MDYKFSLNLPQLKVCIKNYGFPKLWESQFREFQDSQLGILTTKWHLGVGPMVRHKDYYKGKVVVSSKFGPWWILWDYVCSWFVYAPKVLQLHTYQLVFGLCRSVWIIDSLITRFSPHPRALTCLFTPRSAVSQGAYTNSLSFCCFHL